MVSTSDSLEQNVFEKVILKGWLKAQHKKQFFNVIGYLTAKSESQSQFQINLYLIACLHSTFDNVYNMSKTSDVFKATINSTFD